MEEWTLTDYILNGAIIVITLYMLARAVLAYYFPPDK